MTPFGTLVRFFREERGLSQAEMGHRLQVDSKLVSALETGRRQASAELLEKIGFALKLTESETTQLSDAARYSSYVVRIPRDTSPRDLRLVHMFVSSLRVLRQEQITEIRKVLNRGG